MTPKEKAEELVLKFLRIDNDTKEWFHVGLAKQCALIAVDEIILSAPFEPADTDWDEAGSSAQYWYPQKLEDSGKWWAEVKQELEKL
jgi:hypothetical protein